MQIKTKVSVLAWKMKLFFVTLATTGTLLFTASSCKKNKKDEAIVAQNPQVEGFWKGNVSNGVNAEADVFYALLFRNDNSVRIYTGGNGDTTQAAASEGVYNIANGAVSTAYETVNGKVITTATVTNNSAMQGTWGIDPNNSNGGKFALTQQ
jgi:hypothetical protein